MDCAAFSSSARSPSFTGRYVNTVPASVRWTPSTRMSLMTKGSKASAGRAAANTQARRRRRRGIAEAPAPINTRSRFKRSAGEQSIQVVVEGEEGESQQERHAEALSDFHRPLGHGTSRNDFGEIIHQVPSVQQRYRQNIEHGPGHAQRGADTQPRHTATIRDSHPSVCD